jgi:hypothetical protein
MTWQFYASVAGIIVTVLGSAIVVSFRVGRLFERLQNGIRALRVQLDSHLTLLGTLIRILHGRKALDDKEFSEVLASYSKMVAAKVPDFIERELGGGNPLTPEEAQRLNSYINKANRGDFFTSTDVEDYNALVKKVERERPNDSDIWPLVALGAFLLGLFLASKK